MALQVHAVACGWDVQDQVALVNGEQKVVGKTLVIQDQASAITIVVPLDIPVASSMGAKLQGKPALDVVGSVPGLPEQALRNGNNGHQHQPTRPRR